ncbi:hypothetical protein BKA82DRAFT_34708 [Pisolithus tinctorius]|nr:hypothetical protein BKA82DRAFT_34708 [Pisolithus tinctorius]
MSLQLQEPHTLFVNGAGHGRQTGSTVPANGQGFVVFVSTLTMEWQRLCERTWSALRHFRLYYSDADTAAAATDTSSQEYQSRLFPGALSKSIIGITVCHSSTTFIVHPVNQGVAHEIIALGTLTSLLKYRMDDSIETAVGFKREVGAFLMENSPKANVLVFDYFHDVQFCFVGRLRFGFNLRLR